jgi:hypothetical protein
LFDYFVNVQLRDFAAAITIESSLKAYVYIRFACEMLFPRSCDFGIAAMGATCQIQRIKTADTMASFAHPAVTRTSSNSAQSRNGNVFLAVIH